LILIISNRGSRATATTISHSPVRRPSYLLPTSSYVKKTVSAEEARMIKERHEIEKQRNREHASLPMASSLNHQQQQQQHHSHPSSATYRRSSAPPSFGSSSFDHHLNSTITNTSSQFNGSQDFSHLSSAGAGGGGGYNPNTSAFSLHNNSTHQPFQPQQPHPQHQQQQSVASSIFPSMLPSHSHQQQQQQRPGQSPSSGIPFTASKDPEYEYYEQMLREQQEKFANYQKQSASRFTSSHANGFNNFSEGQNQNPEISSSSFHQHHQHQYQQEFPSGAENNQFQEFYKSHSQFYDGGAGGGGGGGGYHPPYPSYNGSYDESNGQVNGNFANQPPMDFGNGQQQGDQQHQQQHFPSPQRSYSLNPSYYGDYRNLHENIVNSSPSKDYYDTNGNQGGIQPRQPIKRSKSMYSNRSGVGSGSSTGATTATKRMDKAQRMLLFGVLHDVLDAKQAWERNLRR
jgi:hypothetical protein